MGGMALERIAGATAHCSVMPFVTGLRKMLGNFRGTPVTALWVGLTAGIFSFPFVALFSRLPDLYLHLNNLCTLGSLVDGTFVIPW
jgi:hypothetical protein